MNRSSQTVDRVLVTSDSGSKVSLGPSGAPAGDDNYRCVIAPLRA